MDDLYCLFGRKLKAARRGAKLTQQEVADRVGLTRTSVTNIERGTQHISLRQLYLLAAAVGLQPSEMLPDHNEAMIEMVPEHARKALEEDAEGLDFAARVLRRSRTQPPQRAAGMR